MLGQNDEVTPSTANAKALSDTLMREIAATGGVKRYPANALLINEGDTADTLFIILSGRFKVRIATLSCVLPVAPSNVCTDAPAKLCGRLLHLPGLG